MHPMVNIALRAARDAGEIIAQGADRLDRVSILRDNDRGLLTSMDENADRTVLYHLGKSYPDHSIESRVSGLHQGKEGETVWLVDPLVGNRNYMAGYSQFAVSVACQIKGVVTHAVLINPLMGEEFTASRGSGSQFNGRRIRVSGKSELRQALLGLNPAGLDIEVFLAMEKALIGGGASPRISGCGALDLAYCACSRLAGGWCANQGRLETAAAVLILREAGGLVAAHTGEPDLKQAQELIFGSPKLFREFLRLRGKQ